MRTLTATVSLLALLSAPALALAATPAAGNTQASSSSDTSTGNSTAANSSSSSDSSGSGTTTSGNTASPSASNMPGGMGTPAKAPGAGNANADQSFVQKAEAANEAEIAAGKLAEHQAGTPAIREFGRWMVTDHTMANDMLKKIVSQNGSETSGSGPTSSDRATMQKLKGEHGASFDHAYIAAQVQAHEQAVSLFRHEASDGQDDALKTYAQNMLPALEAHLAEARLLHGGATHTASSGAHGNMTRHHAGSQAAESNGEHASSGGDKAVNRLNDQELNKVSK